MKDIIKKILRESLNKTITCKKCGWHWKKSESGPDMYFCHKCGHDNTPDNINEASTKKDVIDFIIDFNFLLSLNLAKVQGQAKDEKSKQLLAQMQQKFKNPVLNGKTFFELADERITPRKDLFNPKFLSAYLTQIRNYLVYIKEHINRFVVDGIYKTGWLDRIAKLEATYKNIISGNTISEKKNMIDEAAKQIGDLPEDAALFYIRNGNESDFNLYSKAEDKMYGVLSILEINNNIYDVGRVGTERGYGPFMYEMAMSYIYPKYLMPSRSGDIKSRALNVWGKFYERNDIQKKPLKIEDELFSFAIITGEYDEFDSIKEKKELFNSLNKEEQHALKVFNTMYQYSNPMVSKLINKGNELIKSGEVNYKDLKSEANYYFINLDDY
jgi:hypothetical protein